MSIALLLIFVTSLLGADIVVSGFLGFVGAVSAGFLKELWDMRPGGTGFNAKDLWATVFGGVAGTLLALGFVLPFAGGI